jgi:hypothetical protein
MRVEAATQVRWLARSTPRPAGQLTGGGLAGAVTGSLPLHHRLDEGAKSGRRITRRVTPILRDCTSPVTFGEKPVCTRWMRLLSLNPKCAADRLALGRRQREKVSENSVCVSSSSSSLVLVLGIPRKTEDEGRRTRTSTRPPHIFQTRSNREEAGLARKFHTPHETATGCRRRRKEAKWCAPWPATPPYVGACSGYGTSALVAVAAFVRTQPIFKSMSQTVPLEKRSLGSDSTVERLRTCLRIRFASRARPRPPFSSSKFARKPRTKDEGRGRARGKHTLLSHALKALVPVRVSRVLTNATTFEWTRPDGRVTLGPQPR